MKDPFEAAWAQGQESGAGGEGKLERALQEAWESAAKGEGEVREAYKPGNGLHKNTSSSSFLPFSFPPPFPPPFPLFMAPP